MPAPADKPRRDLTLAAIPALFAAALAGLSVLFLVGQEKQSASPPSIPNCILGDNAAAVGGPIQLRDQNGVRVTQADFAGEPAIVYFGFARCPDACPMTMNLLNEALTSPGGADVRTLLITLDPERDTPAVLRDYVTTAGFPPGLTALTGTRAEIDAAKGAFHVFSTRSGRDLASSTIDHSSLVYVLNPQWRTVAIMPSVVRSEGPGGALVSVPVEDMAACIRAGLEGGA